MKPAAGAMTGGAGRCALASVGDVLVGLAAGPAAAAAAAGDDDRAK